jgi:hypothetical protein
MREIADILAAGARRGNERLRGLVADGKITPAARPRPSHSSLPLDTGRSASAVVLSERSDEH